MKVRRLVALCTAMFLSLQMAELPASAAGRFSDVPAGSPFYESVTYLAECGITAGTGGHSFSPERPITVREWATVLFQAFDGSAFHTAGLPVYNASLYGYEEAGCLRRKTRYALERNLDCAPKRPHHLECSCFRLSIEKSFNRRSMEEKTAAGCSIRAVLWHKSVGSTDSRSGRACNKLRMRLAIMIYLGR